MKSLILTVLYLARDTVHRWFTRLSSPVARVLVVFFLTLCALCFLGTYVISAKVVQDRIRTQGGDFVQMTMNDPIGAPSSLPTPSELDELLGVDSFAMRSVGTAMTSYSRPVNIITYDFPRMAQWLPHMVPGSTPTLLLMKHSRQQPGPAQVKIDTMVVDVVARRAPEHPFLSKLVQREDVLIAHPDSPLIEEVRRNRPHGLQTLLLRVRDTSSSEGVRRAEEYCKNYMRLEGTHGYVYSALTLLREMDVILNNQMQCRLAFSLGIACIVGILLTALAGMEYRQNEYIYTLMKSFGIHPLLLVGAFIMENILLVGSSFVAAVAVFMYGQRFLVQQFFKTGHYSLELGEIMPELQLIAVSLVGCVLVSCVPIICAANRDIGRVLK